MPPNLGPGTGSWGPSLGILATRSPGSPIGIGRSADLDPRSGVPDRVRDPRFRTSYGTLGVLDATALACRHRIPNFGIAGSHRSLISALRVEIDDLDPIGVDRVRYANSIGSRSNRNFVSTRSRSQRLRLAIRSDRTSLRSRIAIASRSRSRRGARRRLRPRRSIAIGSRSRSRRGADEGGASRPLASLTRSARFCEPAQTLAMC